ncbi:MAG TPA: efflux RND transporter permease subunit [Pyrinomonadaceae bacterium]|nr:efflux RND transporter permease subunit [Pyrinomonadaceae bacterium]
MQKLAEICIRRPVFATMIVLSLVVVGAAGFFKLGVDRFPAVDLPTVSVRVGLPGGAPEEVESLITQQVEEVINTVDGISELRSVSGQGTSMVMATFNLDRDLESAAQDVRDRVNTLGRRLPEDATPPVVQKFDNDSTPVLTIALTGDRSIRELTELGDKVARPMLERVGGVGEVRVVGGLDRAINVWIDADRLAAYQISISQVRQALERQNTDVPGGNVNTGKEELTLRTLGRFTDPRQFDDLVIANVNGAPIRLRDLGRVEDGTKEQRSFSRLNGVPTVSLDIRRQSGANTVEVIHGLKAALPRVASQLPNDVKLEVIRDQSRYIEAALHEIQTHLILGSILASLVVLVFMRSWRSTLIAAVAIPCSVISTFGMMKALNFTLNSVTMLALVLMVGVVIDDAIVVLENIFRFIEEKRIEAKEAAREATKDIGLAVLATTLSLVVIFLPVSFMSSISGRFLYQFGITAAVAIMVSLLVSFTLTPMMSSRLIRVSDAKGGHESPASRRGFYRYIDSGYSWLLAFAMRHRLAVALLALGVVLTSIPLYRAVKQEFIPTNVDEAEFEIGVNGPEGTNLAVMNETMSAIEKDILDTPGVEMVMSSAGGGFLGGVNQGDAYVRIKPHEDRTLSFSKLWRETKKGNPLNAFRGNYTQQDVMQEVRRRLRKYAPMRTSVRNGRSFNFGTGGRTDIDFVFRGPEIVALAGYADELVERSEKLGGIVDADTTLKLNKPELRVRIDRERAADLGVDTSDIATSLRLMVGGEEEASRYRDQQVNEDYDVQLRLTEEDRRDAGTISRLWVPSSRGGPGGSAGLVRLDNLVKITRDTSPSRIDRLDRERQVSVRASVAPGYALADRIEALRGAVAEMNLPIAYTTTVSGRARELEKTFTEFIWAFILSVIFMYMILASQFESTVHPLTILLSLPLSVPFALLSLWGTGDTLNLYSALGVLVLFGVVKKNAILQIDHMNNLRAKGMERFEAIMQGNRDRLRPILMTTLALVAGMLPLALGTGPGAEERRSIAIVVIGGQTLSLLLTLIATPVVYSLLDDFRATSRWRRFAGAFTGTWQGAIEKLKKTRRRKPAPEEVPAERTTSGD